jgi:hypothetical protein
MAKTGSMIRTRTSQLPSISVSRHYHASPQAAWQLLTDTTLWPLWGPTVRGVRCSERFILKGSEGKVRSLFGWWIPFVITEYDDLYFWGWKVAGIRATGHRLIALGENSCRVVFELPYWWLPYSIVCSRAAANMAELLKGK